uniref:hypothetical protein n=1 Tax=Rhizobium meliloti TaxID=382 RepID=UPI0021BD4284|nr:hypothetical protein [Sinorhizobium meliloti]
MNGALGQLMERFPTQHGTLVPKQRPVNRRSIKSNLSFCHRDGTFLLQTLLNRQGPVLFGILMDERAASATASASIQRARVPRHEFSRLVRVSAGCLPARLQMTCMYHKKGENGLKTT